MKRTDGPARKPMKQRYRPTGPDHEVVDLVLERDQHSCVCCGENLQGIRGRDWSLHHRRGRGMGSTRRPETNLPANLVSVCGSGSTGCHGWLTENPALGREQGLVLTQQDDPAGVPAATWYGVVLLDNRGSFAFVT